MPGRNTGSRKEPEAVTARQTAGAAILSGLYWTAYGRILVRAKGFVTRAMRIWVDADACPNVIKEILFRTAERVQIHLTLVANQALSVPRSKFIQAIRVAPGFDIADNEIVKRAAAGDLVVTADIPLAAAAVARGAYALNPRGEFYTAENVRERLNLRDFMDTLRAAGVDTGGPAALSLADRRAFANELDRFITRQLKG